MATVLGESFLEFHPESRFVIATIDSFSPPLLRSSSNIEYLDVGDLSAMIDEFWLMATIYDVTEFATSIKPFVMRNLLSESDVVLYIDPDIVIYDRLDVLVERSQRYSITLTPHCLLPMERDEHTPSEHDIMQSGVYNLGYIGVSKGSEGFLDWWAEHLRRDAISDPTRHLFTDQRWIDLAVPIFRPDIIEKPEYNVAYWNLDQRNLSLVDGSVYVNGECLKFFHFSGFDPKRPWWLSKHHPVTPRVLVSSNAALQVLCEDYAHRLLEIEERLGQAHKYRWSEIVPGFSLSRDLRRFIRSEAIKAEKDGNDLPPDPFSDGVTDFLTWFGESADGSSIPRFGRFILGIRADLHHKFGPEISNGQATNFLNWLREYGPADFPWIVLLLGKVAATESTSSDHGQVPSNDVTLSTAAGIDVVGYFKSEHGVGEAGRLAVTALVAAGVNVSTVSSSRTASRQDDKFEPIFSGNHRIKLLAVNADQTGQILDDLGLEATSNSYVIGQWFWEVEEFPDSFADAFELVDEIWVATEFVRDALRKKAPESLPIEVMPLPLLAPKADPNFQRRSLGIDERFLFLFNFDFLSVVERKNPMAVISAYMNAFEESDATQLVIKSINGTMHLADLEELRWFARNRSDVIFIDGYLERETSSALTASADCYVSLHRSEGLGLTISEAMVHGVPTIATNYSGNRDFMSESTAFLVDWSYVEIPKGCDPYPVGSCWADPDVKTATEIMRTVFSDSENRNRKAAAGQQWLLTEFSAEKCGSRMRDRINKIQEELRRG